jgi:ribosomal protein S18 acetylase RimI-like enzyme
VTRSIAYRTASPDDAPAVAALHADSWRRHYRGAYSDEYLDGPVHEERLAVWSERLADPAGTVTIVATVCDEGALAGFVHVVLDADPVHGALVDNLHARHDMQRSGIGAALMARAAEHVTAARPGLPMYLWVLEQNERAQRFYRSIGGIEADREATAPPGGGSVVGIRYVWPEPCSLLG